MTTTGTPTEVLSPGKSGPWAAGVQGQEGPTGVAVRTLRPATTELPPATRRSGRRSTADRRGHSKPTCDNLCQPHLWTGQPPGGRPLFGPGM